jgi:hypothetical protein
MHYTTDRLPAISFELKEEVSATAPTFVNNHRRSSVYHRLKLIVGIHM